MNVNRLVIVNETSFEATVVLVSVQIIRLNFEIIKYDRVVIEKII